MLHPVISTMRVRQQDSESQRLPSSNRLSLQFPSPHWHLQAKVHGICWAGSAGVDTNVLEVGPEWGGGCFYHSGVTRWCWSPPSTVTQTETPSGPYICEDSFAGMQSFKLEFTGGCASGQGLYRYTCGGGIPVLGRSFVNSGLSDGMSVKF